MARDFVFGGVTLVGAAVYYAGAAAIPPSGIADAVGPGGMPRLYAVTLAALSLVLIVRAAVFRLKPKVTTQRSPTEISTPVASGQSRKLTSASRIAFMRATGMLAIGALYVAVVATIGYVLALAGLLFAAWYYQDSAIRSRAGEARGRGRLLRAAIVAACGATIFWVIFVLLLRIQQPAGFWVSR